MLGRLAFRCHCRGQLRFDEASAKYADFGTFYVGMVTPIEELVLSL